MPSSHWLEVALSRAGAAPTRHASRSDSYCPGGGPDAGPVAGPDAGPRAGRKGGAGPRGSEDVRVAYGAVGSPGPLPARPGRGRANPGDWAGECEDWLAGLEVLGVGGTMGQFLVRHEGVP